MMKFLQSLVGATAVAVLFFGGVTAAHAAPTPGSGPAGGGTTVTVEAPAAPTFIEVGTGSLHSVAVRSDGKTYAWGYNGDGQLGNGTTTSSSVPVEVLVPAGLTFTHVSAGGRHAVAVGSDGKTYAWGLNGNGQLGNGTTTNSSVPVEVLAPAGLTFTHVSAGINHSVAVGSDGKTYAWGLNGNGQLGNGTTTNSSVPVEVSTPAGVTFTHVSTGFYHSVAVGSDGKTYAWGYNDDGQLGNGTTTFSSVPVEVSTPAGVTFTHVSAGGYHLVAVGSDGKTYAWGYNLFGQLGNGTATNSSVPVEVLAPAGVTFTHVSAGINHSAAVGSNGKTYAWGNNGNGQLGNVATATSSSVPVEVLAPAGVTFTHVSAGLYHSVAVGSDGKTYAWGYNGDGQLGTGTATDSSVPVEVLTPAAVVTEVSFDGVPGTGLASNPDGTWSVITPAHAPGPVDVVVSWTVGGVSQTPVTTPAGFTYTEAPTITNPVSQSVVDGTTADFEVTATGFPTPVVTWEVSSDAGTTWQDAVTDSAVTIAADGLNASVAAELALDGYQYRATATNDQGAAVSTPAVLTVTPAPAEPTITNPADQTVVDGTTADFGVTATGYPTSVVTWEVSSDDGSSWEDAATDPSVTIAADGLNASVAAELAFNGYQYRATATNDQGTAISAPAVLTVTPTPAAPTITNPADLGVVDGTTAVFGVTATGFPAPVVTWEVSSDDGATWQDAAADSAVTVSLDGLNASVAAELAFNGYQYRATATNDQGTAISAPAVLTVTPTPTAPTITNPADLGVVDGTTAAFGVTATGYPAPVVSWEVSSDAGATWQDAATDPTVTIATDGLNASVAATLALNGNRYRATATNVQGTAVSTPVVLTVTAAPAEPTITNPVDQTVVDGTTANFEVASTGFPAPVVSWEVSRDDGATWQDAATDPTVTIAADGLKASVAAELALNGNRYRATATNDQGTAVSAPAVLTVTEKSGTTPPKPGTETPKPGTETPKPGTEAPKPGTGLARTGSSDTTPIWWAAAGMLALGAALIAGRSRRTRSTRDQAKD